jgi:TIR domain/AbiTii
MAKIFLSHSSKDKDFVRRLADDLTEMGHTVWLDERQIKVGDSIVSKVSEGIATADYVVIVLSSNSVESGWFAKEWEAQLWQEINQGRTMVIPVLIEECEIPIILQPKKYADFRKNYTKGFVELMGGISPILPAKTAELVRLAKTDHSSDIAALLSRVQSRSTPLAQCLTEGIALALKLKDQKLETFCRQEVAGWEKSGVQPPSDSPSHRIVQMYLSLIEINMQSWFWNGIQSIFAYMRQHPDDFIPYKTFIQQSVPQLESQQIPDSSKAMIHFQSTVGQTIKGAKPELSNVPVWIYGSADAYRHVLEAIRQRLTELLLDRLPRIDAPPQTTE